MATVVRNGTTFVNRLMRVVMSIFGFALGAVMLGAFAGTHGVGGKASTAILGVACLAIGVRALASDSLHVGDGTLLIKSLLRTTSFA